MRFSFLKKLWGEAGLNKQKKTKYSHTKKKKKKKALAPITVAF